MASNVESVHMSWCLMMVYDVSTIMVKEKKSFFFGIIHPTFQDKVISSAIFNT